ncbi:DUF3990 domain-containing protein [Clostridium grantii]|uniref:DUF3990 domain-containing protein n=1 Tax=Clostridium grantii DSM 8605 TaxID=1121316 RepID=A0A1M5XX34_9CLOT|nr:DUF3990 domain-containing protein [Clostridium grantii]SHI04385.1 Protein of unknown function [Clostridium grantii DSM 8605]
MESNIELFHGSAIKVEKPKVLVSGFYKNFGFGFYCTNIEKQAKRWSLVKKPNHIVNVYTTHQIVFCTDKALRTLKYERSYSI